MTWRCVGCDRDFGNAGAADRHENVCPPARYLRESTEFYPDPKHRGVELMRWKPGTSVERFAEIKAGYMAGLK